eukprot:CAMPEP_0198651140 /NCGR_PEP_ID=MMETSP1467-20131203/5475_1 /TAXON_ID=1462469 /ORGANISM="unid. sp., Strain CCMP2135" /LENGTH=59 /DNA_ID=CAMNT_0044387019 /DNA_START=135 /DNA_END=311 /DNA_ORIENTATION=+
MRLRLAIVLVSQLGAVRALRPVGPQLTPPAVRDNKEGMLWTGALWNVTKAATSLFAGHA